MSETTETQHETPKGQRDPRDSDLGPLLELIFEGASLRSACRQLGLHTPSTSDWLYADGKREEQYARAKEGRTEYLEEDALLVNRAAALGRKIDGQKIDPSGAKGYLEAVKFKVGRMSPKAKQIDVQHSFKDPSARDGRIAELLKKAGGEEPGGA